MNKKFFKRYKGDHYWETVLIISDGEIKADSAWEGIEPIANPMVTLYQCYNPESCVKEHLRKQEMADILREQLEEIDTEQWTLKRLLASKLPTHQPVLFGNIVAVMDEDGTVLFQKAILPSEL